MTRISTAELSGTQGARWFAAQCQPHREAGAAAQLENQNFRVFLPYRFKTRRHARKLETVRAPFFPGYLFVQLDLARDRWRSVNGTFGVVHLLCHGDRPAPLPTGIVEALHDACDVSGILSDRGVLKVGQSVRIVNGPFADLVGELTRLDDAARVGVLLKIMGRCVPVTFSRESVLAIAA